MKTILILLLAMTTLSSCEKLTNTTWVYYDEASCGIDPWGNIKVSNDEKEKNVIKYFEDKDVKIRAIEILNDGIKEACKACHCKSGIRIKCRVKKKDVGIMLNANFYQ